MYKLSDVAKKLNVEKVLLFEMLLTKGEYLEGNVLKKHGVTYLNDDGIEIIGKIIRGEEIELSLKDIDLDDELSLKNKIDEIESNIEVNEKAIITSNNFGDKNSGLKTNNSLDLEEKNIDNVHIASSYENKKNSEVKSLEILTGKSKFSKFEKEQKRSRISKLRNEFVTLDSEIRKKQEAIKSYDKILEEDIKWVCILEDKLSAKLKEKLSDDDKDIHKKKIIEKMFFKK
ncbi:MAG: hypothetical protein WBA54_11695 [Acidaminobacteraceae bacterium]